MPKGNIGGKRGKTELQKQQEQPRKSLGTIDGEEIRGFTIEILFDGEETETYDNRAEKDGLYKSLKDVYEQIQKLKEGDRELVKAGETDNLWSYEVTIETDTSSYSGYKIRRRKNRLYLS